MGNYRLASRVAGFDEKRQCSSKSGDPSLDRARRAEGRLKKHVTAKLAGSITYKVGSVTGRHKDQGIAGLVGRCHAAPGEQVPARVRARILAATRTHPQAETWLSYWSNREMMTFVTRAGVRVRVASLCGDAVARNRFKVASTGYVHREQSIRRPLRRQPTAKKPTKNNAK